jgi:hypothetical protein
MFCADRLGKRCLEALDIRAGRQQIATQSLGDGRDIIFLDELTPIGKERVGERARLGA